MYTEAQVQQLEAALNKFGETEIAKGLITDQDGPMKKVVDHMEANGMQPTVEGIQATVKAFQDAGHKLYYDPWVTTYTNEYQQLSPEAQKAFNTFWNSPWVTGQLVTGSSKEGYENATKFLVWMHGREMTGSAGRDYLQMAFSNLTAKGVLHFVPSTHKLSAVAEKSQHEPGKFWNDSRIQEREWQRAEAKKRADAEAARDNPVPADNLYKEKWDRLQGNSYAQTSRVRAILISRPDGTPDYKAMYEAGLALLDESHKQPLDRD